MQKIYTKIVLEDPGYFDDGDPAAPVGSMTYIVDDEGMSVQIQDERLALGWEAWDQVCAAINKARKEIGA